MSTLAVMMRFIYLGSTNHYDMMTLWFLSPDHTRRR